MSDEVQAAPGSLLASLRGSREEAEEKLYIDLRVPRHSHEIWVRFKPIPATEVERVAKMIEKAKDPEVSIRANAGVLANACLGIFGPIEKDDPDLWLRFDEDLAKALGKPDLIRAADVVRALYLTDGDVLSTAAKVTEWSGYADQESTEEFEGN
jgi:hypothetical protein